MTPRRASFLLVLILVGAAARVSAVPALPIITQPATDGQILNPADVHMEAPAYSDSNDPPSPHAATDWEIWDTDRGERAWYRLGVTDPVLMVHIHLGDGTFDNSYAGHTQLNYDGNYYVRARFWNQDGEHGDWSQRFFRTSPQGPAGVPGPMPWVVFQPGFGVEIVATGFQLPVNIAFVPNPGPNPTDPFLYVAELYGNIKVMLRNGTVANYATGLLNFDPTGIFPGSGEQGLAGIVVEPATGDVFASMLYEDTTSNQDPKPHYGQVIRLHSADGGHTAAGQTLVLDLAFSNSVPQPFGASHQISNLTIGPDGKLYVHTGDGDSGTAMDPDSFRGKILRANLDGTAPPDNPFYNPDDGISAQDYVFAYGLRNPFGGDWREADGYHYEVENGPDVDRFAKVVAGRNYLWDGSNDSMSNYALYNWGLPCPPCPGAHAPVNVAFVQPGTFTGSGFPFAKRDHAYVTESGPTWASGPQVLGKRIVEFSFDENGNAIGPTTLVEYNGIGRATAVGIAAGPDGLYFTDLYKDEDTDPPNPIAPGANLLRISYNATPYANLAITKASNPGPKVPGASVTYTITASNVGPSAAPGATVTDVLPATLFGASWTCVGSGGGSCTAAGSGSIDDVVNLPAGATVTYTVTATIFASATGTLSNTATIAVPAGLQDPEPGNNAATASDTLVPQADLSITKSDGRATVPAGGATTYTIVAANAGPSSAMGATVLDAVPATLLGASWTCVGSGGGTCTASGSGSVNDTVNLPPGASVTYVLSGTVSATAGSISNTATVAAPAGVADPDTGNNSATDTDVVPCGDAVVVPDGRLAGGALEDGQSARFGAALRLGNSYAVEIKSTAGETLPGKLSVLSGDDGCTGDSTLVTNDTSGVDPSGVGGTLRASFVASGAAPFFRARLFNDTGAPVTFTIAWSDTTQFSPAWSTNASFDTYYSFLNTTGTSLTGRLTLLDGDGAVTASQSVSIPAGATVAANTSSLGVARNRTGTARFTHDGPPGAIVAEAAIASFALSPAYVQPVKFQAVRESR